MGKKSAVFFGLCAIGLLIWWGYALKTPYTETTTNFSDKIYTLAQNDKIPLAGIDKLADDPVSFAILSSNGLPVAIARNETEFINLLGSHGKIYVQQIEKASSPPVGITKVFWGIDKNQAVIYKWEETYSAPNSGYHTKATTAQNITFAYSVDDAMGAPGIVTIIFIVVVLLVWWDAKHPSSGYYYDDW